MVINRINMNEIYVCIWWKIIVTLQESEKYYIDRWEPTGFNNTNYQHLTTLQ